MIKLLGLSFEARLVVKAVYDGSKAFAVELEAYRCLRRLQGKGIPQLIGAYNFNDCTLLLLSFVKGKAAESFADLNGSQWYVPVNNVIMLAIMYVQCVFT